MGVAVVSGYLTQARLPQLVAELTERDLAILATLHRIRMATAMQLERLHFAGDSSRTRRRSLARLVDRRLLAQLDRRIGGVRAGSAGHVYALGTAGQRLTNGTAVAGRRVQRPWTPGASFVAHTLAVSDLYVRLVERERERAIAVRAFVTEPMCWRSFHGRGGAHLVLKPDAFVHLRVNGHEDRWFVEVDRGTEAPNTLARKCSLYRAYWSSGGEQTATGVFPRVLFLVPDEARRAVVRAVFGAQPSESQLLFAVALLENAIARFSQGAAP
jgi:hypothetical protein